MLNSGRYGELTFLIISISESVDSVILISHGFPNFLYKKGEKKNNAVQKGTFCYKSKMHFFV